MNAPSDQQEDDIATTLLYQVTLSSGWIVTRPSSFGDAVVPFSRHGVPLVSEDGRVLTVEAERERLSHAETEAAPSAEA